MDSKIFAEIPPVPTQAEEQEWGAVIRDEGVPEEIRKHYRDQLMIPNVRLVITVARQYLGHGLDLDDLVGEGILGLEKATRKYDPTRGKFSTCAAIYIRNAIRDALSNHGGGMRRTPGYMDDMRKFHRYCDTFRGEHGREPSLPEAAKGTGLSLCALRFMSQGFTQVVSMDEGMMGCDRVTIEETIADERSEKPDNVVGDVYEMLLEHLHSLPAKTRKVVCMRFGIGCPPMNLEQIGDEMGFTRERARQVIEIGLNRLNRLLHKQDAVAFPMNTARAAKMAPEPPKPHVGGWHVCGKCGANLFNGEVNTHRCRTRLVARVVIPEVALSMAS